MMFRVSKKRPPKARVIKTVDNDDEEGDDGDNGSTQNSNDEEGKDTMTTILEKKKKQKKKKKDKSSSRTARSTSTKKTKPIIISFEVDEPGSGDVDELASSSHMKRNKKHNKKRKTKGLGYGGAIIGNAMDMDVDGGGMDKNDNDPDQEGETVKNNNVQVEPSAYGKEALEKLKSEQKFRVQTKTEEDDNDDNDGSKINPPISKQQQDGSSLPGSDYIPLDSSSTKEPVILTGDEAISLNDPLKDNKTHSFSTGHHHEIALEPSEFLPQDGTATKETEAWEAEVIRRAGVSSKKTTNRGRSVASDVTNNNNNNNDHANDTNIAQLKQQVLSTLNQLKTRQDDLNCTYDRRITEQSQTQTELDRQQQELEVSGKAFEYYQGIRSQLTSWVGKLRELESKIKPLRKALLELDMEKCGSNRWKELEDDMVDILREAGCLDQVLGRQPKVLSNNNNNIISGIEEQISTVDEFGRDIKSRHVLEREKRARKRRRIQAQRQDRKQSNDGGSTFVFDDDLEEDENISDGEQDDLQQRQSALRDALGIALNQLDEEYTAVPGLVRVFREWSRTYPEEYNQCFASLSMADLAGVLIQIDMCSQYHPLHWRGNINAENNDQENLQFPWIQYFLDDPSSPSLETRMSNNAKAKQHQQGKDLDSPLHWVVEKVLVPAVIDLLDGNAYNLASAKQSLSFASFCSHLCRLRPEARCIAQLKVRLAQYVRKFLEDMAVPIVKSGSPASEKDSDVAEAITYATRGQVYRLKKLLVLMLRYWIPVLPSLRDFLLEYLSSQFLFLLSSLQANGAADVGKQAFGEVWLALKETKWLDHPDLMLQAAPMRAAAGAYGQY